jgi:hypothetical protein
MILNTNLSYITFLVLFKVENNSEKLKLIEKL